MSVFILAGAGNVIMQAS